VNYSTQKIQWLVRIQTEFYRVERNNQIYIQLECVFKCVQPLKQQQTAQNLQKLTFMEIHNEANQWMETLCKVKWQIQPQQKVIVAPREAPNEPDKFMETGITATVDDP
jgi:hypothetical protein